MKHGVEMKKRLNFSLFRYFNHLCCTFRITFPGVRPREKNASCIRTTAQRFPYYLFSNNFT